ncbi:hypothetical protein C5167_047230 [Papaver somniferum]|uniref:Reverse transcriptase zinc-binding domain-containing protein n=1 Tax=Papaver somniferum TaxID=3469 RepID=A0A4Y7LIJ6_PAPSO|nr:hypothetical protein C5167_047230 [Papaver somniferum]
MNVLILDGGLKNQLPLMGIGKGDKIRLWEDKWCVQGPLNSTFPRLYAITNNKNSSPLSLFSPNDYGLHWKLNFSRSRLYDAEINELTSFLQILNDVAFFPEEDDELVWVGDKTWIFSVKSAYLNDCPAPSAIVFPRKKIWSKHWPHKVGFFLSQLVQNKLPTIDNLQKRKCVLAAFPANIQLRAFTSLVDLHKNWPCFNSSFIGKVVWNCIPASICWNVWLERNARCFSDKKKSRRCYHY